MNRLLLVTIILGLYSPGIYAQNYNPKFDEGPDLAEFLKAATEEPTLQTNLPLPDLNGVTVKSVDLNSKPAFKVKATPLPPGPGFFRGPLVRYLSLNPDYTVAKDYAAKVQTHQDTVAQQLLIDWGNVNTLGSALLFEANSLDSLDPKLYSEAVRINQAADALNKERGDWRTAVAAYNQKCAGQQPTPECTNEYNRLIKWDADLTRRITAHNQYFDEFVRRLETFNSRVDGWFKTLEKWEQDILGFINKADKYLFGDYGTCTFEEWDPLQKAVNDNCHNVTFSCGQWHPNDPIQDCSIWREYVDKGIACFDARHRINTTCYNGGNPGHTQAENDANKAIKNCRDLINRFCKKVMEQAIPGRKFSPGF